MNACRQRVHFERRFAACPITFVSMVYHQIRFVSFGIWFLGLFLTDVTAPVVAGDVGFAELIQYMYVTAIVHVIFVSVYLLFLAIKVVAPGDGPRPSGNMVPLAALDLSLHLDVAIIAFAKAEGGWRWVALEALAGADALLTFAFTPFKMWRGFGDLFAALPTIVLVHAGIGRPVVVALPLIIAAFAPLAFSTVHLVCDRRLRPFALARFFDASLVPNLMEIERATTGGDYDWVDFKAVPFAVIGSFIIHWALYAQGTRTHPLAVNGHWFLALGSLLLNSRVVALPAIILTNVADSAVRFSTVCPELSFV